MLGKRHFRIPTPVLAISICLLLAAAIWFAGVMPRQPASAVTASRTGGSSQLSSSSPAGELRQRIQTASVADYPALMRVILRSKDPRTQQELVADLMRRWLNADMASFIAFLDEAEIEGEQVWARLAPGMMAALNDLDPEIARSFQLRDLIERVIAKSAETDPRKALAWAREQLTDTHLDSALAGIATELVNVDADAAMALVSEIKSMSNRMEAATGVGLVIGERDPETALAWAQSFALESERAFALSGVLTGMANRDVDRAAEEYSGVVATMKEKYRQQVEADRAASGPSTEEEYEGLSAEEILKAELAKPNPNLSYLENAAYVIGTALARENPQGALDWAKSLDIYQGNAAALEAVFEEWANQSAKAAFRAYLLQSERRPELAEKLFGAWASSDPSAASAAALGLSAGLERDSAVEGVARGWIDSGAPAEQVARWSEQLGSASEKDRVHAVVAAETAFENPVFAWEQIQQMRNNTRRAQLFQEVFPSLVENNPKVARRALASVHLSQVETEYFQNMLDQ